MSRDRRPALSVPASPGAVTVQLAAVAPALAGLSAGRESLVSHIVPARPGTHAYWQSVVEGRVGMAQVLRALGDLGRIVGAAVRSALGPGDLPLLGAWSLPTTRQHAREKVPNVPQAGTHLQEEVKQKFDLAV